MRQFLTRSRHAVAVLTAIAVFTTSTNAFACKPGQPGESCSYNKENIANDIPDGLDDHDPFRELDTFSSFVEARNNGSLLRVWRAASSDNSVWMAYGFGDGPFQIGGPTETEFAPTVVPFGSDSFMVLYVGTDNLIRWNIVTPGQTSGNWQTIPGQSASDAVSAVQFSGGNIQVVYKGTGTNDLTVYGTWYDGRSWHFEGQIAGGLTFSSPSVTFNPQTNQLVVAVRGTDQAIWTTSQFVGQANWNSWTSMGQTVTQPPRIIAAPNGNYVMSYVGPDQVPMFRTFNRTLGPITDWTPDRSGFLTFNPVTLVLVGAQVWALLTGLGGVGFNKQVTTP